LKRVDQMRGRDRDLKKRGLSQSAETGALPVAM
jgi:hypothetical protein